MNGLYLQNLYNLDKNTTTGAVVGGTGQQKERASGSVGMVIISILRIIMVGYAAWAFLVAAMLFIGRYVAFMFLIALSPIGFVGGVIPRLASYSKKWLDTLIDQTVVASVFLLGVYLVILLINSNEFKFPGASNIAILSFVIVIIAIKQIVDLSKKLSGEFGEQVSGFIKTGIGLVA